MFLDTARHPHIEFALTDLDTASGHANGTLTVKATTRPIRVALTVQRPDPDRIIVTATVTIDRSDYGAGGSFAGIASVTTHVTVTAVFVRQHAG